MSVGRPVHDQGRDVEVVSRWSLVVGLSCRRRGVAGTRLSHSTFGRRARPASAGAGTSRDGSSRVVARPPTAPRLRPVIQARCRDDSRRLPTLPSRALSNVQGDRIERLAAAAP